MNRKLLLTCSCFLSLATANAQMPKWVIPPYLIDFPASGAPVIASSGLTNNSTTGFGACNGAFDKNGNLLFYTDGYQSFLPNGTQITSQYSVKEVSVIPVPGLCNRYYIIGTNLNPMGASNLWYSMIVVNANGNISISPGYDKKDLGPVGFEFSGIAISKMKLNKARFLFTVGNSEIRKFRITSSGITFESSVTNLPGNGSPKQADLYENPITGAYKLAFIKRDQVFIVDMDNQGNYMNTQIFSIPDGSFGEDVEFFASGTKLLASTGSNISTLNISNGFFQLISNSQSYSTSQIEKAPNNKYYARSGQSLAEIDLNTLTINQVLNLPNTSNSGWGTLPDQVDDEDYFAANFKPELIARDNVDDIGMEPNREAIASNNIWASRDLWNRRNTSGNPLTHQEPGYGNFELNNLMKMRITNIGCRNSDPSFVRMYWALGSTGEHWPETWIGAESINGIPIGGEIQTSTVYSTYTPNGYPVPSLAPGGSAIIEASWHPPTPSSYNSPIVSDNAMIRFLGRIDDSNDPMYDELPGPLAPVKKNILNNNNIVTRNTSLINLPGDFFMKKSRSIVLHNYLNQSEYFDINFLGLTGTEMNFATIGKTEITLDPMLWEAWMQNGANCSGLEISNPAERTVRVSNLSEASLRRIKIAPGQFMGLSLSFTLNLPTNDISEYHFLITQERSNKLPEEESYGTACQFILTTNENDNVENMDPMLYHIEKTSDLGNQLPSISLSLNPNPSDNFTELTISLTKEENVQLSLLNMEGKMMMQIAKNDTYASGEHTIRIDTDKLTSGIYILFAKTSSGIRQSLKMEVNH